MVQHKGLAVPNLPATGFTIDQTSGRFGLLLPSSAGKGKQR